MKKIYLAVLLACSLGGAVNAQVNVGGIPWSVSRKAELGERGTTPVIRLKSPDFEKAMKEDAENEAKGVPGKYRAALAALTDITVQNSGSFTYLADGSKIWNLKVTVPASKGIKIAYDAFQLPQGVTYYVQNSDGKQLIGGYNYLSNVPEKTMGHDMVIGEEVNLELDIAAGVNVNDIVFHITHLYGMYRGLEIVPVQDQTEQVADPGSADPCHINAKCPQAAPWFVFSKAVAHIWIFDGTQGGWCSGTLINNTSGNCAPLFLTASHCDEANMTTDAHFDQWEFTFGYMSPICGGGGTLPQNKRVTGANFKARSDNPLGGNETGPLDGDFLLLQLRDQQSQLKSWDLYLAGWDRTGIASNDSVWVAFHHPAGDIMKFTKMRPLDSLGSFNTDHYGTHWAAKQVQGGAQGGSSGSGLWKGSKGQLIGDLTGGSGQPCATTRWSLYSKLSRNWEYPEGDGTAATRLKEHLDPGNTGVMMLDMAQLANGCPSAPFNLGGTSVRNVEELSNGISIYPNPSSGMVHMKVNLAEPTVLTVNVVNVLGAKCGTYTIATNGTAADVALNMSSYSNGMYLLQISSEKAAISKKVVLKK